VLSELFSLVGRLLLLQQVIERSACECCHTAYAVTIFGEPFQQRRFQHIVVGVKAMFAFCFVGGKTVIP
jgi:hypothetical protein